MMSLKEMEDQAELHKGIAKQGGSDTSTENAAIIANIWTAAAEICERLDALRGELKSRPAASP